MDQAQINQKMTETFVEMLKALYIELGPPDMSQELSVDLHFDDMHRVTKFENLTVNNSPVMPSTDLTEKLNTLSMQFNDLGELNKLDKLHLEVAPGGKMNIVPTYKS